MTYRKDQDMTDPFKAERTGKYTCGHCLRVFRIVARPDPAVVRSYCENPLCKLKITSGGHLKGCHDWIVGSPYQIM